MTTIIMFHDCSHCTPTAISTTFTPLNDYKNINHVTSKIAGSD